MQDNVSVCTIVKNGMDTLPMWLEWAMDNFSEVNVVCDTVNEDGTLEFVIAFKPKHPSVNLLVHKFDDFSSQWNRAIAMSNEGFCLYMGSDEIIEEMPNDCIVKMMCASGSKVGILERFNLQGSHNKYNKIGYPDYQYRVIDMTSGIKMNGKLVDETLSVKREDKCVLLPWSIIHFGHIRSESYLRTKGRDRIKFADSDNCDGKSLKEYGENWFVVRNKLWESNPDNLEDVPPRVLEQIEKYYLQ